jgi:ankyrin repeat protein
MGGRTALFIAAKSGAIHAVKVLLAAKASPTYKSNRKYIPYDVATTDRIKQYLVKA